MAPFRFDGAGNLLPAREGHTRITYKGRLYDICPFKTEISVLYRHVKGAGGWRVQHLTRSAIQHGSCAAT